MAKAHGFRIYFVQAFENQIKGNTPVDVSKDSVAKDLVVSYLERLHAEDTYFFPARKDEDGLPDLPSACITVGDPAHLRDDLIHLEVSIGQTGSHHRAVHEKKKKAKQLGGYAPESPFFVTLLFPQDAGDRFILISQTKNNGDPVLKLRNRLHSIGRAIKKDAAEAEKKLRKELREAKKPRPPKEDHVRLLFDIRQAADNAYLDELFSTAKEASAKFTSYVGGSRGSGQRRVQRQLSIRLRGDNVRGIGKRIAQKWRDLMNSSDSTKGRDGVSELAGALYDADLFTEDEKALYDDASITLVSEENDRTIISVDTLRDVFTYPVSNGRPSIYFHYSNLAERVKTVAANAQIEVKSIDPHEVNEWMEDSTQAA